jgi:hypothetical protein
MRLPTTRFLHEFARFGEVFHGDFEAAERFVADLEPARDLFHL